MEHKVRILHNGFITHDVRQIIVPRPEGFEYEPGQGMEIALDAEGWRDEGRPFTPTSRADAPVLEFTIKGYFDHDGVTRRLHDAEHGTDLLMSDPFGSITYRGPGTFVAGGAGVTPFLAILRQIEDPAERRSCSLLFTNRTPADVICEKELRHLLGDRCHLTCTQRSSPGYDSRRIDRGYLEEKIDDLEQLFYVCGPQRFVGEIVAALEDMGADPDRIVVEE